MSRYFKLRDHEAIPCSFDDWLARVGSKKDIVTQVACDELPGDVMVSTVFLGLNHQYGDGPPLVFETMIFGGEHDQYQDRCSTWSEAEAMHATALALAKGAA